MLGDVAGSASGGYVRYGSSGECTHDSGDVGGSLGMVGKIPWSELPTPRKQ